MSRILTQEEFIADTKRYVENCCETLNIEVNYDYLESLDIRDLKLYRSYIGQKTKEYKEERGEKLFNNSKVKEENNTFRNNIYNN